MVARRDFLRRVAAGGAGLLVGHPALSARRASRQDAGPFVHGVASGDPLLDRVILWTRVSLVGAGPFNVGWRVATDPDLTDVVASGTEPAAGERDFTVKVDADGLSPGTTYFYGFDVDGKSSPVGRTRTAPQGPVEHLRFGVVSCSSYVDGWFNAYGRLADREVDLVVHLGDYIYEHRGSGAVIGRAHQPDGTLVTLADYRGRHAQHRTDPDLQALHQRHPVVAVWDDHEIAGNAWRDGAEGHDPDRHGDWAARRDAATRAFLEWLPVRETPRPVTPPDISRALPFGDLAELVLVDTRLAGRDRQVGGDADDAVAAVDDPDRTLLGAGQRDWAVDRLRQPSGRWSLLANQVMFSPLRIEVPAAVGDGASPVGLSVAGRVVNPDQWDGYTAERDHLLEVMAGRAGEVVVLAGDVHSSWAFEVPGPPTASGAPSPTDNDPVAVEFVTPAVSSPPFATLVLPPGSPVGLVRQLIEGQHPYLRFCDLEQRGYVVLDVTPERVQADWWFVDTVEEPSSAESFGAGWVTTHGSARLTRSDEPAAEPPPTTQPPAPPPSDGRGDAASDAAGDGRPWPLLAGGVVAAGAAAAGAVIGLRTRKQRDN